MPAPVAAAAIPTAGSLFASQGGGSTRAAVPGTDKVQGYSKSIGAAAAEITVGIRD